MRILNALMVDLLGRRKDDFNWRRRTDVEPLEEVRNVLVLHLSDKIGDAVVYSRLVDALVRARPRLPVAVGTTARFASYWRSHPGVADVVVLPPSQGKGIVRAYRAGRRYRSRFDVVVSFDSFALPDHFALLRGLRPRVLVGFNKHSYRLFDHSLEEGRHGVYARQVASRIESVMGVFGVDAHAEDLDAHAPFGPEDEAKAQAVLDRLAQPGPRVLVHTYGAGKGRVLTTEAIADVVEALRKAGFDGPTFVGVPEGFRSDFGEGTVPVEPLPDLTNLFALVAKMDAVVATDTSVGHIAAALGKPQIALFTAEPNLATAWRPLNERCVVVRSRSPISVSEIDPKALGRAVGELRAMLPSAPG